MSYQDRINAYRRKATDEYRNLTGASAEAQAIDPNDRTLTIEVTPIYNSQPSKARVFGASLGVDESYNTANNASVVVPESSHLEVKQASFGSPFRVKGIIYTVSDVMQLAKPLTLLYKSLAGVEVKKVWQPQNFTDPRNYNDKMIKTAQFQMVVDAFSRIEFELLTGASATMVLTINDMLDASQALSNRSVVKTAENY